VVEKTTLQCYDGENGKVACLEIKKHISIFIITINTESDLFFL